MTTTTADTPQAVRFFQLLSIIGRLKIEIETGMTSRIPTLRSARVIYGLDFRTRKQMLAHLEAVRDLVKSGEYVLLPTGEASPSVGLYEVAELQAVQS